MKITALIARILLGFIFLVVGLNGFLNFLPAPPMPPGLAGQFWVALIQSQYMLVVFALQVAGAVLLLINRYVALALTALAPVIVNIDLFHVFMDPGGLPRAVLVSVLWTLAA